MASVDNVLSDAVTVVKAGNTLKINASAGIVKVEVIDSAGKVSICGNPDSNNAIIDCTGLARGLYLVRVNVENNEVIVKKFIR